MAKRTKPTEAGLVTMTERLLELELALERGNWIPMASELRTEFSREGLDTITQLARLNYIKNPLIKRGVNIQTYYVFGRGVTIQAKDEEINAVIQAFIDDTNNQNELTSPQARKERDKELRIDGNLYFALFVEPSTGQVRVGTIPPEEIRSIIRDPNNRKKNLYYKRQYTAQTTDTKGKQETKTVTMYYRDLRNYNVVDTIGEDSVDDTCVIYHVKVGGFTDWAFGVSEIYAAIDWARAYKSFLEDFAKIIKSLARFAWRQKVDGGAQGVAAARNKLNSTYGVATNRVETNPSPNAGAVAIEAGNTQLDPIKTAGMTTSAESGKELRLMSGIAMGLPDHIASGDTAQGTLATAKSLDRPTEFQFTDRQELWVGIFKTILDYVVFNAVVAPDGVLRTLGTSEDNVYGEPIVIFPDNVNTTVTVDFPSILQQDLKDMIAAWVLAAPFVPDKKFIARQLLSEFGIDDADELTETWYPGENGGIVDNEPILTQVKEALEELKEVLK